MTDVRAFTTYENHRIAEMERHSAPLMWMVIVAVLAYSIMGLAEVYWMFSNNRILSEMISECAKGKPIYYDNVRITCTKLELVGRIAE